MAFLDMKRIPSSQSGKTLHTLVWTPENPRAVLQIVHGMAEHIARYDQFARWMCEHDIAVIGHSHLGHGLTASGEDDLGYFSDRNGWKYLTDDIHTVRCESEKIFPTLPHFILGHSMGSFLLRTYLTLPEAEGLAGAIFSGTGNQPSALMTAAQIISGTICLFRGKRHRSEFINSMSFGGYGKSFRPARTDFDWLSRSNDSVDEYIADPTCGFCFTAKAFGDLFGGLKYIGKKSNIRKMPKNIPCLFVSGSSDPVGNNGKEISKIAHTFREAGMRSVEVILYDNARHEILNEINREEVFGDIFAFMERCCPKLNSQK